MNRMHGALCVLAAVVIIATVGFRVNTDTANWLLTHLEKACMLAESNDTASAADEVQRVRTMMSDRMPLLFMFSSHTKTDEIEVYLEKASAALAQHQKALFIQHCRSAAVLTRDFRDMEYPSLYNIL